MSALLLTGTAAITAYAFLGSKPEEKVNTIRIGEQTETIQETFAAPTVQTPTDTVQKVITVQNTGSVPCFVRVYPDLSDSRLSEGKVRLSADTTASKTYQTIGEFRNVPPANRAYSTDNNAPGGYFYYTKALAAGATTPPLLTSIRTEFSNAYDISDSDIIVYSETVQTVEIDTSGTAYTDNDWETAWKKFLHVS